MLGTYKKCSNCKIKNNCCNSFKDSIDNVLLEQKEYFNIIKNLKIDKSEDYFYKIDDKIYNIKTNKNGTCKFYKDGKCSIYDYRPNDCRLYPFDIIKEQENYYLILYKLKCIDTDEIIEESIKIQKIINEMKPWLNKYTDDKYFPKLKQKINKKEYMIVKKLEM